MSIDYGTLEHNISILRLYCQRMQNKTFDPGQFTVVGPSLKKNSVIKSKIIVIKI